MSDHKPKAAKRAYVTPRLVTYGNITTLTQSNTFPTGKADGGGKVKTKTRTR